jgi:mono/diheme cytochrome c family protein
MMPSRKAWIRMAESALALLGAMLVSGCDTESYPEDLSFPPRTDPIVTSVPELPDVQPKSFDSPGQLGTLLGQIVAKGGKQIDPVKDIPDAKRKEVTDAIVKIFGTPAHPKLVTDDTSETEKLVKGLGLDEATLLKGSKLYRRHCLHCHGITGDGHGPTATWVNPHPRDYRLGVFKFTSSAQGAGSRKPRRADLLRTLRQGIEGTSMPSFGLLPAEELEALASVVTHLSLRGQVEADVLKATAPSSVGGGNWLGGKEGDAANEANELAKGYGQFWLQALEQPIKTDSDPFPVTAGNTKQMEDSIKEGFKLFKASCLACHVDYGRADNLKYDEWGTIVRPANLTVPIYRGGRRPIDIYYRAHSGIGGARMPAAPDEWKDKKQLWHVINFVQALPYKDMLPRDVRQEIYGD